MFISVDLPAPFSPSRAWTSPWIRSRSIRSLASTPGNCFVIPASSRRGASAIGREVKGRAAWTRPSTVGLLDRVGDLDLPVDDLLLLRLGLLDRVLRRLRAGLAEAHAVLGEAERRGAAADLLAVDDLLDRLEDGLVDLLLGRRQDVVAEERLVGVHADAPLSLLLRSVQRTEAAASGHLEDDVGALGDLVERDLLALRLVDEVLRVAVERLRVGIRVGDALLVARDE